MTGIVVFEFCTVEIEILRDVDPGLAGGLNWPILSPKLTYFLGNSLDKVFTYASTL